MTQGKACVICRAEYPMNMNRCHLDGGFLVQVVNNPLVGRVFADTFEVEALIGFGGMSVVYKVRHVSLKRVFALKILHPHLLSDDQIFRRFQLEARTASSLNHPNVIKVYEAGVSPERLAYLIMDFVDGFTIGQIVEANGHLEVNRAVNIFAQVCDGLEHAHQRAVLHRDLKPSNIMVSNSADGELAKLLDFGIAKLMLQSSPQLTQEGEVCGTPEVMSPEQCLGKPLDARSDIYSLGCMMYESLTGIPPHIGDTILDTMTMHIRHPVPTFDRVAPTLNIPQAVQDVVLKCLEKNPDARWQSADQLGKSLRAVCV